MAMYRAYLAHMMEAKIEGTPTVSEFLETIELRREDRELWRLDREPLPAYGVNHLNVFLYAPGVQDFTWPEFHDLLDRPVHWIHVVGNCLILHTENSPEDPSMGAAIVGHSSTHDRDMVPSIEWIDRSREARIPQLESTDTSSVLTHDLLLCPPQSELYVGARRYFQVQHGGYLVRALT